VASAGDLRERLQRNARLFRARMQEEGFDLLEGEHPIIAVMFGDAVTASKVANEMLAHGVYVTAFTYPVVPKGKARIRVQLSAAHSAEDIEVAVRAFVESRAAM
jgi:glycine C-acetyltransferase